jgi:hypothetical protein
MLDPEDLWKCLHAVAGVDADFGIPIDLQRHFSLQNAIVVRFSSTFGIIAIPRSIPEKLVSPLVVRVEQLVAIFLSPPQVYSTNVLGAWRRLALPKGSERHVVFHQLAPTPPQDGRSIARTRYAWSLLAESHLTGVLTVTPQALIWCRVVALSLRLG